MLDEDPLWIGDRGQIDPPIGFHQPGGVEVEFFGGIGVTDTPMAAACSRRRTVSIMTGPPPLLSWRPPALPRFFPERTAR